MSGHLPPGCTQRECDEAQPGYYDEPMDDDTCPECGGEGIVFDCFDGFCEDAESGCELCERPCPTCAVRQ